MVRIELWLCDLDCTDDVHASLIATLGPDEIGRAARFVRPADRRRFEVRRGMTRTILAGYTGSPAPGLTFAPGEHGKPYLTGPAPLPAFSVSHSLGMMLLGVSWDGEIGVDIEACAPLQEDIAPVAFTAAECRELAAMPLARRDAHTLRLWTAKEAVLKAAGTGLFTPPTFIEITLGAAETWSDVRWLGPGRVHDRASRRVYSLKPREGYIAAVAAAGDCRDDSIDITWRE